jgi:hypothetical protein
LRLDVGAVLLQAWQGHRALLAAATRTREPYPAPAEEKVLLAKHEIGLTQHPEVDVTLDGRPVITLHFELSVTATVHVLSAVVRVGRLVAVESGRCEIKVAFSVQGAELAAVSQDLDPTLVLALGDGVPLGFPHARDMPPPG